MPATRAARYVLCRRYSEMKIRHARRYAALSFAYAAVASHVVSVVAACTRSIYALSADYARPRVTALPAH